MRRIAKNGGERAILALSRSNPDAEGVPAAEDVMKTNSFTVEVGGRSMMALFPRIAVSLGACEKEMRLLTRRSESTMPASQSMYQVGDHGGKADQHSAMIKFDQETLSMTARPLRDILPGEEITISCWSPLRSQTAHS